MKRIFLGLLFLAGLAVPALAQSGDSSPPPNPNYTRFRAKAAASIPTPNAGTHNLYFDSAAGVFKYKNSDGSTVAIASGGGSIAGLTSGKIPVATSATALGDSILSQSGSVVTAAGTVGATTLTLNGATSGSYSLSVAATGASGSGVWPSTNASGALVNDGSGNLSWSAVNPSVVSITNSNSPYTPPDASTIIVADPTSGNITINLRAASTRSGQQIWVKNVATNGNTVTIDGNASETIDGALTLVVSTAQAAYTLVCDGSNWRIY